MKKYHLERIDVVSVTQVSLIIGLTLGLILGIVIMICWATYEPIHTGTTLFTSFIMICMFAVTGACIMGFLAWLYNLIASKTGGISLYISEERILTLASGQKEGKILS